MGVLQNVIREIGDIVNRLSVSSKEKQKIQEEIQSLVYRYKSELVREQSLHSSPKAPNPLCLSAFRGVKSLQQLFTHSSPLFTDYKNTFYSRKMRIYAKIFCKFIKKAYLCSRKMRIYAKI